MMIKRRKPIFCYDLIKYADYKYLNPAQIEDIYHNMHGGLSIGDVVQDVASTNEKNIKNVKLIWHFLQHGIELRSSRTEIELQKLSKKLMAEIKKITKGIKGNLEFAPKKSILCNWCYYWEECPAQNRINPYIK